MKKRISALLAVVLTIALLASSFAMLGVNAEDPATGSGSEKITIGTSEYTISTADKFNARDIIADALENTAFSSETEVELTADWNVAAQCEDWGHDTDFAYYQKSGKAKLAFQKWLANEWQHEIVIEENGLVVNPAQNGKFGYIQLDYTAPKTGEIVIYDVAGSISAIKNADPHWGWWDGGSQEVTVTIYKNGEKIWPTAANEANIINRTNDTLIFPDLGKIAVVTDDVITVKFDTTAGIDPMLTDLEVAYVYEAPSESKTITIGDSVYTIKSSENYIAYDEFKALTKNMTLGTYADNTETTSFVNFTNSKWSMSYQYTTDKGFGKDAWGGPLNYEYCVPHVKAGEADSYYHYKGIQVQDWTTTPTGWGQPSHYNSAVTFIPATNNSQQYKFYVSPSAGGADGIPGTLAPAMKLTFKADKAGDVVLYDTTGEFSGEGTADEPYLANKENKGFVTIKILKNDSQIWPKNNETAKIDYNNNKITFPDLGEIAVMSGDEISIVVYGNPEDIVERSGVFMSPAAAYIDDSDDDSGNNPDDTSTTEKVTIDGKTYDVLKNNNYDLYSDLSAAVKGLTPGDCKDNTDTAAYVKFNGKWVMEYQYTKKAGFGLSPWNENLNYEYCNPCFDANAPKIYGIQVDYYLSVNKQNVRYNSSACFVPNSNKLYVSPSTADAFVTAKNDNVERFGQVEPAMKFTFTADKDGYVVLYDKNGEFSCDGTAVDPYWANENDAGSVSIKILKNGFQIWPKEGETAKIDYNNKTIAFPDLGKIAVTSGDKLSIVVYGDPEKPDVRSGVFMSPAVAYTELLDPSLKFVNIGNSTYVVKSDSVFNARDTIWDLVDEMDATKYTAVDMLKSVWQAKISRYKGKYADGYTFATSVNTNVPTITPTTTNTGAWDTSWGQNSINFHDDVLYVSPWVASDKTAAAIVDMVFTAPKKGDIVIYDVLGSIVPHAQKSNASPFYAWLENDTKNEVSVTIFKNNMQIWPTDDKTDNTITSVDDMIVFPDLGFFKVFEGDTITVRFQEKGVIYNATDYNGDDEPEDICGRDAVRVDLEIAYLAVESPDPITEMIQVGNKYYEVLIGEQYDAYSDLSNTVKDVPLGNALATNDKTGLVNFKGNWSMQYQYTSDKGYGVNPWGDEKFGIKYCSPYFAIADRTKNPGLKGLQPAYYLSINEFSNCFFTSSILLLESNNSLFISPTTSGAYTTENIDENLYAPALKLTYTSNIDGKAVLLDKTGMFSGNGVAVEPYWANESDDATVKIEIYHNNKKIWPTGDKAQVISKKNPEIAFPDLGEIELKIGDKINYVFYANPEAPSARAALICNPGIAFTEVTNKVSMDVAGSVVKTDANFGTEVMVLVSVIVALGGVVVSMGAIAKKRVKN